MSAHPPSAKRYFFREVLMVKESTGSLRNLNKVGTLVSSYSKFKVITTADNVKNTCTFEK